VNVSAGTARLGAVALHAVVEPVPAAIFVAAQLPLVLVAPFVPAGVPPDTELVVSNEPLKVGTPPGQVIVSAGIVPWEPEKLSAGTVPACPLNTGAATVPVGVIESDPPVPPTSLLAANVPRTMNEFSSLACVKPVGQVPLSINMIAPDGKEPPPPEAPTRGTKIT
jgi:hypothetical protein